MKRILPCCTLLLLFQLLLTGAWGAENEAGLKRLNEAFRPKLYAELPDCCPIPDGMTLCSKTNLIYLVCPNYEPSKDGKKLVQPVLMALYPDGRVEKLMDIPLDEKAQDAGPMGIDIGPDGNLYVADNLFTGFDGPKSRILRVVLNPENGMPTGEVNVVAHGLHIANGLLWDGDWMFVTDPVIIKAKDDPAYGKGGLWRFHISEFAPGKPIVEVTPDVTANDPHLVATMDVQKTKRGDIGGLDGITKAWGAIWVGNVGDGSLFSVTFDEAGKAIVKKEFQDPDFRCCDGIFYDAKLDVIFIDDPEDNCIRVFNRQHQMKTLWQDPDNDGSDGQLDEPSECIVRDGKLIIANFDRPFPGLTNTKHDKPYTLSYIDLTQANLFLSVNGEAVNPSFGSAAGVWFYCGGTGTQALLLGHSDASLVEGVHGQNYRLYADVAAGDTLKITLPFGLEGTETERTITGPAQVTLDSLFAAPVPPRTQNVLEPVACSPDLTPFLMDKLVEWDWRMQDGIETPREVRSFQQAIEVLLHREGPELPGLAEFQKRFDALQQAGDPAAWEALWRDIHRQQREQLLSNPIFNVGELLFVKHVPSVMSHQLTQVYGYCARPGGGLFVLEQPGKSCKTRSLSSAFPTGNFMKSEISPDGKTLYTAFCACDTAPEKWRDPKTMDRHYQIYAMDLTAISPNGQVPEIAVHQLTRGDADSFAPVVSPTGEIIYLSTLRGTYHRCGAGPCRLYTLTLMDANGDNIRPISVHETNEWDPTVLDNGRIVYTRWDYVDRNAVHYQNLWQTRLDGTDVRTYYGNMSLRPCGIWETRQVPNSTKVMAIAGPHHGMSAGSVILIDTSKGVDGDEPLEMLTKDVAFPETDVRMAGGSGYVEFDSPEQHNGSGGWFSDWGGGPRPESDSQRRWPGQTCKAPYPLSEDYFIVSCSFDRLRGELAANIPNMYGLYFADRWGHRELIYRDPNISSLWAIPLVPPARRIYSDFTPYVVSDAVPPVVDRWQPPKDVFGTMLLQNVYDGEPSLPEGSKVKALRIVQVLPKSTPDANSPMLGWANASPGKQILGTVPVEEDGSAFFELPACIPVLFQALDEQGRAIQTMRSLTYLQPGENANCIGCHEDRMKTPEAVLQQPLAARRAPSKITPGPDGSKPFSYPRLVQPVWDKHCVTCHNDETPNGVVLTGQPEGQYSKSYNQLAKYVRCSAWGNPERNYEPLSPPGKLGTLASPLREYLEPSHHDVALTPAEKERIYMWIDGANALFYGTFLRSDQARQQRGELIEGPDAE